MALPPDRLLNYLWMWCMERVPQDRWDEWVFNLDAPLPGETKKDVTPQDWEDDGEAFMAAMGSLMGGGR